MFCSLNVTKFDALTWSFDFIYADPALSVLTSGPYGLIFSSFVPFFFDIPVSTRFRVASLSFSDKSFIYLAGLQVDRICLINYILLKIWPDWKYSSELFLWFTSILCGHHYFLNYAAFIFILEKIPNSRSMWHSCWFPVSFKRTTHP